MALGSVQLVSFLALICILSLLILLVLYMVSVEDIIVIMKPRIISIFGIGDKDQYFNQRNLSNKQQQTRGIYEMIFGLIRGVREVIKPVQDKKLSVQ